MPLSVKILRLCAIGHDFVTDKRGLTYLRSASFT